MIVGTGYCTSNVLNDPNLPGAHNITGSTGDDIGAYQYPPLPYSDLGLRWNILNAFTADQDTRWSILETVHQSNDGDLD